MGNSPVKALKTMLHDFELDYYPYRTTTPDYEETVRVALAQADRCLAKTQTDEPIFVLRAQDVFAPRAIRYWADCLHAELCPPPAPHPEDRLPRVRDHRVEQCPQPKVREALQIADAMMRWPDRKIPD